VEKRNRLEGCRKVKSLENRVVLPDLTSQQAEIIIYAAGFSAQVSGLEADVLFCPMIAEGRALDLIHACISF
jgi:hypothetical protein